jgi:two-component sensor histidine kinase
MDHDAIAQLRRQVAAFSQFTSRSLGEYDLGALMLDACLRARAGVGVSHAKLLEYQPDRDRLLLRAGVGWKEGYIGSYAVPPDLDTPIGHAFHFAEPVPISDYAKQSSYKYPAILNEHHCISSVNVPVRTAEGSFGVLEVDHTSARQFSPDDIYFLTGLGNTIAQAIHLRRSLLSLSRALEEKQLFAREMNHRIKNNLSLVGSVLALQSRRIQDSVVRDEFHNAIQRINNLALVHDRLQMLSQMKAKVDARAHFDDVAAVLKSMLPAGVRLTTMCSGFMPGDCIESLTLLANELVTNAAKYAFEDRATGEITIGFRQEAPGWRFWVQDDGIGMPAHDPATASFGTQLIDALVTRINAAKRTFTTNRTRVEISFGVPAE